MSRSQTLAFLPALLALGLSATAQNALKSGDTLTYTVTEQPKVSGGHLPAQAYKLNASLTRTVTVTVNSLDTDGAAVVRVKSHKEPPAGLKPLLLASWEQSAGGEFDAKLSSEGALLIPQDSGLQPGDMVNPTGLSQREYLNKTIEQQKDPAYKGKEAASEVTRIFALPNVVALSAAKRASNAVGDTWRVTSNTETRPYDVTITGKENSNGGDVLLLAVVSKFDNPNGASLMEAQVRYDAAAHLIVSSHCVTTNQMAMAAGVTSVVTTQIDLKR